MSIIIEREAPETTPASNGRSWRFPRFAFFTAIVALVGLLVLLYPSTAAWVSQYYQSQLIVDVSGTQEQASNFDLDAELAQAHAYNDLLVGGGAYLESDANKPAAEVHQVGDFDYNALLRATSSGAMGRLQIPSIKVDLPVYHGTDDVTLTKGVGHLEGTSLPVGGNSQHSVLTAHRGLPEATLFDHLDRVRVGDTFTIEVFGEVLTYRVRENRIVAPDDTDTLRVLAGEDLVTLVTCTPLGINSHRILVTGERVTPTPIADIQNAGAVPDIPGFPWWIVGLGGGVLLLSGYVWQMGRTTNEVKPLSPTS